LVLAGSEPPDGGSIGRFCKELIAIRFSSARTGPRFLQSWGTVVLVRLGKPFAKSCGALTRTPGVNETPFLGVCVPRGAPAIEPRGGVFWGPGGGDSRTPRHTQAITPVAYGSSARHRRFPRACRRQHKKATRSMRTASENFAASKRSQRQPQNAHGHQNERAPTTNRVIPKTGKGQPRRA
jgi:hypothetical protein